MGSSAQMVFTQVVLLAEGLKGAVCLVLRVNCSQEMAVVQKSQELYYRTMIGLS
jgi:hypothetical protein